MHESNLKGRASRASFSSASWAAHRSATVKLSSELGTPSLVGEKSKLERLSIQYGHCVTGDEERGGERVLAGLAKVEGWLGREGRREEAVPLPIWLLEEARRAARRTRGEALEYIVFNQLIYPGHISLRWPSLSPPLGRPS